jgi:hypothetical protein
MWAVMRDYYPQKARLMEVMTMVSHLEKVKEVYAAVAGLPSFCVLRGGESIFMEETPERASFFKKLSIPEGECLKMKNLVDVANYLAAREDSAAAA